MTDQPAYSAQDDHRPFTPTDRLVLAGIYFAIFALVLTSWTVIG